MVIGSDPGPGSNGYGQVNSGGGNGNDPERIDQVSATVDNTAGTGTNDTALLATDTSAASAGTGAKTFNKLLSIEEDVPGEPPHLDHDLQEQLRLIQASRREYPVVVVEPVHLGGPQPGGQTGMLARTFFKSQPELVASGGCRPDIPSGPPSLYPISDTLHSMLTRSRSTNIPRRISGEFQPTLVATVATVTTVNRSTSPVDFTQDLSFGAMGSVSQSQSQQSLDDDVSSRYSGGSCSHSGDDHNEDSASYCSAGSNSSCGSSYDERCSRCLIMGKREPSRGGNAGEVFL